MVKMKKGKVLVKSNRQVGKSNKPIDKQLKALAPGKRMSANGKVYYENRRNRSDLKDDAPTRVVGVKKHTRLDDTIDVKKHERVIPLKQASSGSKMNVKDKDFNNLRDSDKQYNIMKVVQRVEYKGITFRVHYNDFFKHYVLRLESSKGVDDSVSKSISRMMNGSNFPTQSYAVSSGKQMIDDKIETKKEIVKTNFKVGDRVITHMGDKGVVDNIRFQDKGEVRIVINGNKTPWRTIKLKKDNSPISQKPKFKVGDNVIKISNNRKYLVQEVKLNEQTGKYMIYIDMGSVVGDVYQDEDKFKIDDIKPIKKIISKFKVGDNVIMNTKDEFDGENGRVTKVNGIYLHIKLKEAGVVVNQDKVILSNPPVKPIIPKNETPKERQQRYMKEIKSRVNAPYVSAGGGAFGSETVFVTISLDNKSDWANGYIENSRNITFRLLFDEMKIDTIQESYKLSKPSFRKSKFKNVDDAINKINDYLDRKRDKNYKAPIRKETKKAIEQSESVKIKKLEGYLKSILTKEDDVSSVKFAVIGLIASKRDMPYDEMIEKANKIIEIRKLKTIDSNISQDKIDSYKERQENKKERYEELAEKNKREARSNAFDKIYGEKNSGIPFGQPILVGHHSERGHRNQLKRMDARFEKGIKAGEKADYYSSKAKRIEESNIISNDDPEAVKKLREKITKLEIRREKIKEFNKKARKEGKEQAPSYMLQNLAGNIRTNKLRMDDLIKRSEQEDKEYFINGVRVEENVEDNRLRIHFDGKPSDEMRTKLKGWGFRWSPYNKAWQRQLNNNSRYSVKQALK